MILANQEFPVDIVGSSSFGRYLWISPRRTYNMFVSDDILVSFAGYANRRTISSGNVVGRAIYHVERPNFLICVIGTGVYRIDKVANAPIFLFSLNTDSGYVSIADNLTSQVAIVDGTTCWIYNYVDNTFGQPALHPSLVPNTVTYQNTQFIFGNANPQFSTSEWFVYRESTGTSLIFVAALTLESKPDFAIAVTRIPGKNVNIMVFGKSVAELWTNVGGGEVYQRNSSVNIDYGCVSVSTIAANETYICWLSQNETSSPSIMIMEGGRAERISTDGIDFILDSVKVPEQSTAFFYRQDGHLFYQLTFYNPADDFTLLLDLTNKKFYDLVDWDNTHHPARQVTYFNQQSYFVSLKNGNLYEMGSDLTTYDVDDTHSYMIDRRRTTGTIRLPKQEQFIAQRLTLPIETGAEPNLPNPIPVGYQPRIDLTISRSYGEQWSNAISYYMRPTGYYQNQVRFNSLGAGNQITFQLRFLTRSRVVVGNGNLEIRM